ncbi:MAG: extracellular solute-binding protein, partial [Treponema sp.]|nr:extracellular solute-binding protein [Treponema sp.]
PPPPRPAAPRAPRPAPAGGGGPPPAGSDTVTITTLTRWTGTEALTETWQTFCAEFEKANPGVKINDISVNEEASFNNKFRTMAATGELPNVFYLPGIASLVKYAESKMIADITPLFSDKAWYDGFVDGAFDMFKFDPYGVPGVYAVPFASAPEGIYYNVDLFKKIGLNKFPETMPEFYAAMDKLKAIGIYPFAPGARDTWRTGHIHNQFLYKWAGVPAAMDLGARKKKWTDPDIVQSLAYVKDMKDRGYFAPDCEAITFDMEKAYFFEQKAAMTCNGSWFIGEVSLENPPFEVAYAPWPYFPEKPQFKGHIAQYPQNFCIKGGMTGREYEMTVKFLKQYTGLVQQTKITENLKTLSSRKDVDISRMDLPALFRQAADILNNSTMQGGDSFDYDQLSSMQDVTRNAIIGMLLGNTPQQAAQQIQDEIDKNK